MSSPKQTKAVVGLLAVCVSMTYYHRLNSLARSKGRMDGVSVILMRTG